MSLEKPTTLLRKRMSLNPREISKIVVDLLDDRVLIEVKEQFLLALETKGESAEELAAFAQAMREYAVDPKVRPEDVGGLLVDTCGTGGDKLGLFNISTAAALVLASAGVPVAKHGNRAVTSGCGSADVLEALGVKIDLPAPEAKRMLQETGFAFFFAPLYHPAFKKLALVRKRMAEQGHRSVFNLLGPMLNPARPNAQVIGVYTERILEVYANALLLLGARHALVVHGQGMDELTTLGTNFLAEKKPEGEISRRVLDPRQLNFTPATLDDLKGGSATDNAKILEGLFRGEDRGPRRDIVLLNAAAGFIVAGRAKSFAEGVMMAAQQLDSGAVAGLVEKLRRF